MSSLGSVRPSPELESREYLLFNADIQQMI